MARLVALLSMVLAACVAACSGAASTAPSSAAAPSAATSAASALASLSPASPSASPVTSIAASASLAGELTVSLSEWKVVASSTFKAGKATFTITNAGTVPHEFLIFQGNLKPSAYPTDAAGDIEEDAPGVKLLSDGENIDPGGTQSRAVDLTPGQYLFVCNIPGHFKQGMFAVVTVTP